MCKNTLPKGIINPYKTLFIQIDALDLLPIGSNQLFFHMAKQTRLVKLHGKYQLVSNHWNGGRDIPWLKEDGNYYPLIDSNSE